ncbi:MAG: hypothetical protein Q7S60_01890 [bacterium]|nr:hypothetical protein [bacterium]
MVKNKLIIGLVGEKGGGKGAFTEVLREVASGREITHIQFRDVIQETLELWGIPATRQNLTKLAVAMTSTFEDAITHATFRKADSVESDIIIFDGIRWQGNIDGLRQLPNNVLVYVTADPEIRYQRAKARKEKVGEGSLTFEEFMKEEQLKTELLIPQIGRTADFTIKNNGTLEEFKNQVKDFYREVQPRF